MPQREPHPRLSPHSIIKLSIKIKTKKKQRTQDHARDGESTNAYPVNDSKVFMYSHQDNRCHQKAEIIQENRNTRFPQQWGLQQYLLTLVSTIILYLNYMRIKLDSSEK